jgi:effector-binding domain-containing protein
MPVEEIRGVLHAPDPVTRDTLIAEHLRRLESDLGRTRSAIATLRDLLEHPESQRPVERRHLPRLVAAAITEQVTSAEIGAWLQGALGELYATVSAQGQPTGGVAGGVYADGLFEADGGEATVYLPAVSAIDATGRVRLAELPAVGLAVVSHHGPETGVDRAYGDLAAYLARHAIGVAGPIREFYPVNRHHTGDQSQWRTEIGWPIFPTGPATTDDNHAHDS